MPCKCNTAKRDPDCTNPHTLSEMEVAIAFPNLDRGPAANPNPMNARCGLEDCDCEYTIGGLLRRLEMVVEQCTAGLHPLANKDGTFRFISWTVKRTVVQTRSECPAGLDCPCYQDGSVAERRPVGA